MVQSHWRILPNYRRGQQVAEDIGWFEMARSGGYIMSVRHWLVGYCCRLTPATVFTIIGDASVVVVFIPVLQLPETYSSTDQRKLRPIFQHMKIAIRDGSRTPAIWLTGSLEAITFTALIYPQSISYRFMR